MNVTILERLLLKVSLRTSYDASDVLHILVHTYSVLMILHLISLSQEIAFEACPFDAVTSFAPGRPNYKEKCRRVAYGICQGSVGAEVEKNGCSLTTGELLELQEKCEGQVNEMTGGPFLDDDRFDDD